MEQRRLGAQGLVVPALGLGCMGMSQSYGPADEQESLATIHRALDLGMTFLDTADIYGPYTNERLVGQAIAGRRDEVVLATKFGNQRLDDGTRVVNGRPDYVRQACDASLERLGEDDFRRNHPRFTGENFARNLELVERVRELAERKGATPSQLAIAWVLARGDDVVPIPGTKRRRYLEENLGALEPELTPDDLAAIEELTSRGAVAGDRYNAQMMANVNV
jgi:aryl-alcohol dehydrogenase-like predicted oxidoreductase